MFIHFDTNFQCLADWSLSRDVEAAEAEKKVHQNLSLSGREANFNISFLYRSFFASKASFEEGKYF